MAALLLLNVQSGKVVTNLFELDMPI